MNDKNDIAITGNPTKASISAELSHLSSYIATACTCVYESVKSFHNIPAEHLYIKAHSIAFSHLTPRRTGKIFSFFTPGSFQHKLFCYDNLIPPLYFSTDW